MHRMPSGSHGSTTDAQQLVAATHRRRLDTRALTSAASSAAVVALALAGPASAENVRFKYCEVFATHNNGCIKEEGEFYLLEARDEEGGSIAIQGERSGSFSSVFEAYSGNVASHEWLFNSSPPRQEKAWHSAVKDSKGSDLIRAYRWSS